MRGIIDFTTKFAKKVKCELLTSKATSDMIKQKSKMTSNNKKEVTWE